MKVDPEFCVELEQWIQIPYGIDDKSEPHTEFGMHHLSSVWFYVGSTFMFG